MQATCTRNGRICSWTLTHGEANAGAWQCFLIILPVVLSQMHQILGATGSLPEAKKEEEKDHPFFDAEKKYRKGGTHLATEVGMLPCFACAPFLTIHRLPLSATRDKTYSCCATPKSQMYIYIYTCIYMLKNMCVCVCFFEATLSILVKRNCEECNNLCGSPILTR